MASAETTLFVTTGRVRLHRELFPTGSFLPLSEDDAEDLKDVIRPATAEETAVHAQIAVPKEPKVAKKATPKATTKPAASDGSEAKGDEKAAAGDGSEAKGDEKAAAGDGETLV